jgi:hypothetical protein
MAMSGAKRSERFIRDQDNLQGTPSPALPPRGREIVSTPLGRLCRFDSDWSH